MMADLDKPYLPGSVWTYLDMVALFFGGLVGSVLAIGIAAALNGGGEPAGVSLLVISSLGQALVIVGMLTYMSRTRGAGTWSVDFGFQFRQSDLLGIVYGMMLQIGVVVFVQLPILWVLSLDDPPQQAVAEIAEEANSVGAKVAILIVIVLVAPVTEELLYRGVLLGRIRRGNPAHRSVVLSAAVFAGIHLIDPNALIVVPGLFVVGLVLGYQALHTGRLGLSIMTHAGVNLLAVIGLFLSVEV